MLVRILLFLLDTVCSFFTLALLVRFAMQWARASFRNPLGQFIVAVTDWMLRPVRRFVPGLFGLDIASLLLAWLWQVAFHGLALGLSGVLITVSLAPTLMVAGLAALELVKIGLYLAMGVIFVQVILSWVNPYAPIASLFNVLAEPILRPFRRIVPAIGGVDISPMIPIILIQVALFIVAGVRQSMLPVML